jgi:esterase/lipase
MPVVAVGASMGGMAAVEAVARDTVIKGVVTISAPHLWQGSEPIEVVGKISPRPLLVIAADKDPHLSVRAARLLYLRAGDPREWLLIGATRHGTDIFATDQKRVLERAITDFLLKYFKPQKPAKS